MTFEDALKAMREGKKVRLPCWIKNGFMIIDNNNLYFCQSSDPELESCDIMSDDWEIIE